MALPARAASRFSRLDSFFTAAARFSRRPSPELAAGVAQGPQGTGEQLLREATELLAQHPERGPEIAISVQRLRQRPGPLTSRFAVDFARLSHSRLPPAGTAPTRAQAHEALVSYVALHDITNGSEASSASVVLGGAVARGAHLLEAPTLAAALLKVGAGDAEVAMALQRPLAEKATLMSLNVSDLCAAVAGIARASKVLPEAAGSAILVLGKRLQELPPTALCDTARMVVELRKRLPPVAPAADVGSGAMVDQLLTRVWPVLMKSTMSALREAATTEDRLSSVLLLAGLGRLQAALLQSTGPVSEDVFADAVLRPCAPLVLQVARQDLETAELAGPLLRTAGGTPWGAFLAHLALECFPRLPAGRVGAERLLATVEVVAGTTTSAGGPPPAFPPFFDFALEELMRRLSDLEPRRVPSIARLFGQVHLERLDLLGSAASAIAGAAETISKDVEASELALCLSSFAPLYIRLAMDPAATGGSAAESAMQTMAGIFEAYGAACQDALTTGGTALRGRSDEVSSTAAPTTTALRDAACLALSAFTQVVMRTHAASTTPGAAATTPSSGSVEARMRIVARGRGLLEAASAAWARDAVELTAPQTHIFVTAFRSLCIGDGVPPPPPAVIAALQAQRTAMLARAGVDRDARLGLAVLEELARDPACPEALRAAIAARAPGALDVVRPSQGGSSPTSSGQAGASARLRQHVQASAAQWKDSGRERQSPSAGLSAPLTSAFSAAASGQSDTRGFLRRLFGI